MMRLGLLTAVLTVLASFCGMAIAQEQAASSDNAPAVHPSPAAGSGSPAVPTKEAASIHTRPVTADDKWMRIEGEKRFRTNCGRCHMAPHKFPPRTMATIVRHMRVRAMITDEDMRLILRYMTQ
jgi:mono/diheme cytochrome c family protein